jgi:catalase (peroxidase I)
MIHLDFALESMQEAGVAAKKAGHNIRVPFTRGCTDATQETD